ncbi:DUF3306 domain-containing protein [Fodinicurvata fenggangensis]|uniref:DUF3306 domain-containing protein n=1 Tax=Fodinicurvata fenggangensis TaxID=1121830 RepID=UPI00068B9022|nr:DUF3306 domain-containing protein [Fodinicurvata fenggangensis]
MNDRQGSFFRRWSTRKQSRVRDEVEGGSDAPELVEEQTAPSDDRQAQQEMLPPDDLPDPETLGRDADWSVFMKSNVPAELRRRAMQQLWRVDPVYANLDGLVDYADDYNDPVMLSRKVKTLFQVGRGMVMPDDESQDVPEGGAEVGEGTQMAGGAHEAVPEDPSSEPDGDSNAVSVKQSGTAEEGEVAAGPRTPTFRSRNITPDERAGKARSREPKGSAMKRRWDLG